MNLKKRIRKLEARLEEVESWLTYDDEPEEQAILENVQYVREIKPPDPISEPLDFDELWVRINDQHAHYIEQNDVWRTQPRVQRGGVYL